MIEITDPKGYAADQKRIDYAIIAALAEGPKTQYELSEKLRQIGVGDAKSNDRLEISYSKTGAIGRAAVNSLRSRGLIYDSWDAARNSRQYEKPFRFYLTNPPAHVSTGDG